VLSVTLRPLVHGKKKIRLGNERLICDVENEG
ncbi:hypothetical protein THOM_2475, partial [Trachipleistophora hominis]